MSELKGPVLFELDEPALITPASAPPVPETEATAPTGQALQMVAALAVRKPSLLGRLFWAAFLALVSAAIGLAAWDFVFGLLGRNLWLGRAFLAVIAVFVAAGLGIALKEWVALVRLKRVDRLRSDIAAVSDDTARAAKAADRLSQLYRGRADMTWALDRLAHQREQVFDADALMALCETTLMTPLDAAARREVEASARQVAVVTAIVPLALADVVTALAANMRMVRRIAEIYGGRAGFFGSWRLLKTVMLHLVATGAVAVGDDLIHSVAGGGLLSKLSRRFGEGVVNGALTARVGIAAMEVCRPMPFAAVPRPKVTGLVKNALAGLFGKG